MSVWIQIAIAFAAVALISFTSYQWGYKSCALRQSDQLNKSLAASAKYIIDQQYQLQIVEDIIGKSTEDSKIKSPILLRTLVRLRECEGKTSC